VGKSKNKNLGSDLKCSKQDNIKIYSEETVCDYMDYPALMMDSPSAQYFVCLKKIKKKRKFIRSVMCLKKGP
jgi:hypothetical protein